MRPYSQPEPSSSSRTPSLTHSSQSSSSTLEITANSTGNGTSLLGLQIRAFIEASDDVEIDAETLADLMNALPEHDTIDDGSDCASEIEHLELDEFPESQLELDISALYAGPGMSSFITEYVKYRHIPIPDLLLAFEINLCPELRLLEPSTLLFFLRVAISRELSTREKLEQYNTIDDAVRLIQSSKRILILTGAGISVSCGIPDFRSRDGLYASLAQKPTYELDDPQQMFDISYFKSNPAVFYSFASQIYPSNFVPSPCHRFIKLIEDQGKLLRNYTQNIDTLETLTGVKKVLQCHGSFATASCVNCRRQVPGSDIEADIMRHRVPLCTVCNATLVKEKPKKKKRKSKGGWQTDDDDDETDTIKYPPGIMKPDITFFGEKLTDDFDDALTEDREQVDLLMVIGTSLKVSPVAEILSHLPHSIPQILINKTPVKHINPDIVLLGNADMIVQHLADRLLWTIPPPPPIAAPTTTTRLYPARNLKKRTSAESDDSSEDDAPTRVGNSHVWLFPGAEGGRWLEQRMQDCTNIIASAPPSTQVQAKVIVKETVQESRETKRLKV